MNENLKNVEVSGIRKFFDKVTKVEGAISLTLGQPDFTVPIPIKEGIIKALNENKTTYTPNNGIPELREKISEYLSIVNIHYNKEEICVTAGGSEGLFCIFTAILNKGDKILIPSIAYPSYEAISKILGAEVIYYNLKEDLSIDIEDIKEKIKRHKIKAMVLSFPSNPTGTVLSKKDLKELHDILKQSSTIIISDEIYSSINFEDNYYSISQYEDILDRVILISGFSKMFSMTGLRIGYVCAKEKYIKEITKVHQYNASSAPSIVQWGVYEGFEEGMEYTKIMRDEFKERSEYVYNRLISMGIETNLPKGAFYIFPSIKKYGLSSEDFCLRLLEEAKVALVPGSAFGPLGEGYARVSFSYSMETLKRSLDLIEVWLKDNF
ncbi:aminotransferase, classes I and II [Clostridium putrefaciens]|uniref:Aminotransferase n=1 Tax=Clostridium putrefaciens TaxID=99675 RepID=A0A381J6P3_9CLOT|nr:aminotransferase class I/II-fold pyridoxal phosphate-dependent enzyme [Clostridium putrefaciens]SUY46954.1 aminotransferase, classes I and II [Clostridium putrefaciens]